MKHLKKYKIFESTNIEDDIEKYLKKMSSSKEDIKDIYIDLIDHRYEIEYDMWYYNIDGVRRREKLSSHETPQLMIILRSVNCHEGGSDKYTDTNLIESIYHSISRFIDTYKDKCDISYELRNNLSLYISCGFDTEIDESKLSISRSELSEIIDISIANELEKSGVYSTINNEEPLQKGILRAIKLSNLEAYVKSKINKDNTKVDNEKELDDIGTNICKNISYPTIFIFYPFA